MTLYDLKPRFQALLHPVARRLAAMGATANQVTVTAVVGSLLLSATLLLWPDRRCLFLLLPIWLLARMALNAIDGMLAREFGQKSRLGGYLNELCDLISDAALVLPFAFLAPFDPLWVGIVIFLAAFCEYAGVMGPLVGATRRYDGPLGKSDRALAIGVFGAWIGSGAPLPEWLAWIWPAMGLLLVVTAANRVQRGLGDP